MDNEKPEQENDIQCDHDKHHRHFYMGLNVTNVNSQWTEDVNRKPNQDCGVRLYGAFDGPLNCSYNCAPRIFQNDAHSMGCAEGTFKHSAEQPCVKTTDSVSFKKPRQYLSDSERKSYGESELSSSQIDESTYACKTNEMYSSQVEHTYDVSGESMVLLGGEYSLDELDDQMENENYMDYENSNKGNENGRESVKTDPVNFHNVYFPSAMGSNEDTSQGHSSSNRNTEMRVKIKFAPDTLEKQDEGTSDQRAGFIRSLKNAVHSCIGKRAASTPIINNEDIILPACDQLDLAKTKSLIKLLEASPEGVDMKLSLFMSACAHDPRNLQPFPQIVLRDNDINRHLLYYIAEEVPSVNMILFLLKEKEALVSLRKELLPVVDWLLRVEDPRLELLKEQEKQDLLKKLSVPINIVPTKIFLLKTKRNNENEQFWQNVKGDSETIFAYHTCRVDQAHALLYYGLHNNHYKKGVFGQGVYLTDNLTLCLDNSSPGYTWGKSSVATKVKLIFVTELISNHSVLSYDGHGAPFNRDKSSWENYKNARYYFIKKPKLVRLRYLMAYVVEPSVLPINPFSYVPIRKKLIKYLGIIRISLLIATLLMGATASQRKAQANTWFIETIQNCYQKFSTDLTHWPIWQYIETPYVGVPAVDRIPQSSTNYF